MNSVLPKTAKELKSRITPEIRQAGRDVLLMQAATETIRSVVTKYRNEVLKKRQFKIAQKWINRGIKQETILNEEKTYLMEDGDFKVYLKDMEQAHKDHGFIVPKDMCPLLIAESNERRAWWKLVDLMEPVTGIGKDKLFNLIHVKRYRELTLAMLASK